MLHCTSYVLPELGSRYSYVCCVWLQARSGAADAVAVELLLTLDEEAESVIVDSVDDEESSELLELLDVVLVVTKTVCCISARCPSKI